MPEEEIVPDNYVKGRLIQFGQANLNTNYYTDGKIEIRLHKGEEVPEGFVLGRCNNEDRMRRSMNTKILNGTSNTSKPEEEYYKYLVSMYGEDDVIWRYSSDPRYPFECDFYIKSQDRFIELNYFPHHGSHPFDPTNEEDLARVEELKKINSRWSLAELETWTIRDVRKQRIARENNLNYEVIY